jgi:hypothetical protein
MRHFSSAVLLVVVLISGCTLARQYGTAYVQPGTVLSPGSAVLLPTLADGGGRDGKIAGSGAAMTSQLANELQKRGFAVLRTDKRGLDEVLAEGRSQNAAYVVLGQLTVWEDNATYWSDQRDQAGLALELYDVSTRRQLGTVKLTAEGTDTPSRCVGFLASSSIDALQGRPLPDKSVRPDC